MLYVCVRPLSGTPYSGFFFVLVVLSLHGDLRHVLDGHLSARLSDKSCATGRRRGCPGSCLHTLSLRILDRV